MSPEAAESASVTKHCDDLAANDLCHACQTARLRQVYPGYRTPWEQYQARERLAAGLRPAGAVA